MPWIRCFYACTFLSPPTDPDYLSERPGPCPYRGSLGATVYFDVGFMMEFRSQEVNRARGGSEVFCLRTVYV